MKWQQDLTGLDLGDCTKQPLHQGAEKAGKTKSRRVARHVEPKVAGLSLKRAIPILQPR